MKYLRAANVTTDGLKLDDVAEMDITPQERNRYSLQKGDLLIVEGSGSSAHVGRTAIWNGEVEPCSFQNHLIRFRPHAVAPGYAFTVFTYYVEAGVFSSIARGVGVQHLGTSRFAALNFPLPPWNEQERIAAEAGRKLLLSREAEESLRSALSNINHQITAILETAATGQLLTHENPVKIERQHDPLDDQNAVTPELPLGWTWVTIRDAGALKLGRQRSPKYEHGPYMRPYLRVANVLEDRIDSSNLLEMNFSPAEQETYRLVPGDILLNDGQSAELVGRPAMYEGTPPNIYFQNHLIRFRAAENVNPRFALLVFRHYMHSGRFTAIAKRSTNIATLGMTRFSNLPFPLPPRKDQDRIVKAAQRRLEASETQRAAAQAALEGLTPLRLELLAAAVSGRLAPQFPEDEPASKLLDRLGEPNEQAIKIQNANESVHMRDRSDVSSTRLPLVECLHELGGRSSAEQLFSAAGYDRDSTADVEAFYLQLRAHLDKEIRVMSAKDGSVTLEAASNASR
jgi:type I restriction enzyme S subunit